MSEQTESPIKGPPLSEITHPTESLEANYSVQILDSSISEPEILDKIVSGIQTVYYLTSLPHTAQEYTNKKGKRIIALRHGLTKNAPEKYPWAIKKGFQFGNIAPEKMEEEIRQSLKPESETKYIIIKDEIGEVVGFNKLIISKGEKTDEEFTWLDDQAHKAYSGPHIESDMTSVHPAYRTITDANSKLRPSQLLVQAREDFARKSGIPDIFTWVVSTHIPNNASQKFQKNNNYRAVCTVSSYSVFANSTGYYKHLEF